MKFKNLFVRDAWNIRISKLFAGFSIRNFIITYYHRGENTWTDSTWLGVQTLKTPTDLWIYQELIFRFRPDFIIETGTWKGGSALYMATICEMIGHGTVITIDIKECETTHPRIHKIVHPDGSTSPVVVDALKKKVGASKCLVMLDSTHRKQHVLDEMNIYSQFVPIGWYMIVEDTCLGGNPVLPSWTNGPMDAVQEFLKKGTFVSDRTMHKFLLTFHPEGFLKRIK